jgi:predicted N-formylglutamate amidohydrolase
MTEGDDPLLAPDEPPAVAVVNAHGAGSAVVVCDHASNRVPRRLAGLGLVPAQLVTHIAWDPGAEDVARRVAEQLDAPLVVSRYSRLVIDCNRPLASEESIAVTSAGTLVPGNCAISSADRALRAAALFRPYHRAIAQVLNQRSAAGRRSLLLSIHSFTPVLNGGRRPWQVAFSYGRDARLALLLLKAFTADGEMVVGHNQPYGVDDSTDYTIPVHGEQRGLPHVLIEIRQDGLATADDCISWALRLAAAYSWSEASLVS